MKKIKVLGVPYAVWLILFVVFPLVLLFFYAFTTESAEGIRFSIEHFRNFFTPIYIHILWDSIILALESTLICLVVGYPLAYIISKMPPKKRNIFLILLILPTWMNSLLRTYSWMNILGKHGIINKILELLGFAPMHLLYNEGAVLFGMVYNFLPFMVYPIYSVLIKIRPSYFDAAMDLGANRFNAFWKITFPLSMPGVITGFTMVFMPAVSTFVITDLLGGGHKMYIGNLVQHQFLQKGDWNFGSVVSIIMMIVILLAIRIMNSLDHTADKEKQLW